jgi:hypothetical protein
VVVVELLVVALVTLADQEEGQHTVTLAELVLLDKEITAVVLTFHLVVTVVVVVLVVLVEMVILIKVLVEVVVEYSPQLLEPLHTMLEAVVVVILKGMNPTMVEVVKEVEAKVTLLFQEVAQELMALVVEGAGVHTMEVQE